MEKIVFYDVETTGIPLKVEMINGERVPVRSLDPRQPHVIQLAAIKTDGEGREIDRMCHFIQPNGWELPPEIVKFNEDHNTGITQQRLEEEGIPLAVAVQKFVEFISDADRIVAHNNSFDKQMMRISFLRVGMQQAGDDWKADNRFFCTMRESVDICKIPNGNRKKPGNKLPKLVELFQHCFGESPQSTHNAMADTTITKDCYFMLFKHHPEASIAAKPLDASAAGSSSDSDIGFGV